QSLILRGPSIRESQELGKRWWHRRIRCPFSLKKEKVQFLIKKGIVYLCSRKKTGFFPPIQLKINILMSKVTAKVAQIIGPVIDVEFESGSTIPKIYDSLEIIKADGSRLVLEVQSHIGENTVRTISMDSTDGLSRGVAVNVTGSPIQMPIGEAVYGRLFNVIGDAIDGLEELPKTGGNGLPIHREAPKFEDLSTSTEVLFTGIKVIDL